MAARFGAWPRRSRSHLREEVAELDLGVFDGDVWQLDVEALAARGEPRRGARRAEAERVRPEVAPRVVHDPWPVEGRGARDELGPPVDPRPRPGLEARHRFGGR